MGHDPAGVGHEHLDDAPLQRGECHALAGKARLARIGVELQVAATVGRRAGRGCLEVEPAQHRAHARHELEVVERLADVVVGTGLQAADLVDRLVTRCEHDDRDRAEGADLAEHGVPVAVGQPDVEQHEVGTLRLDQAQPIGRGGGLQDVEVPPLQLEAEPDRGADVGIVIDEQELHGAAPGTTRLKALPRPTSLSTSIVPSWACAIASAVGRPMPAPPPAPA